jgi:hypothetical protein
MTDRQVLDRVIHVYRTAVRVTNDAATSFLLDAIGSRDSTMAPAVDENISLVDRSQIGIAIKGG